MYQVLPKIPLFNLSYRFGWPQILPINYTFIISTFCNSRCKTCYVWKQKHEEMTITEWEKVLKSIGKDPFWVTISGGEPFIQPHLTELATMICKICEPAILNIPTNSTMQRIIPKRLEEILKNAGRTQVIINLSLDGVGEKHDAIRRAYKNFEYFKENYTNLKALQKTYDNLTIGIHSVISKFNVDSAQELFDYALGLKPDQYITEIAEERKELGTQRLAITPNHEEYSQVIDELIRRIQRRRFKGVAKITEAFRIEYYQMVKEWLKRREQIYPCFAGVASCQISSWGEVWPCCIRGDNMGNLRDAEYDFRKVWWSPEAQKTRRSIKNRECECPLANASYTNMLMNLKSLLRVGFKVLKP